MNIQAPIIRLMLWGIIVIIFAFDWYHTAVGLREFRPLNLAWGSYIFATLIFAGLIVFAAYASAKSKIGWGLYLSFAFFAFICNFNVFYPNQMGRELIHAEITEKHERLTGLIETTRKDFRDTTQEAFISTVNSKIGELEASVKNDASGRRMRPLLEEINKMLNASITRIKTAEDNNTPEAREMLAQDYKKLAASSLDAVMNKSGYLPKLKILQRGDSVSAKYSPRVELALSQLAVDTVADFTTHAQLLVELTSTYNTICTEAKRINASIECNNLVAQNYNLRTLSHTFSSMQANFGKGGTLTALAISIFMNFIFPISLIFLTQEKGVAGSSTNFSPIKRGGNNPSEL
jgi:hypothetical protein